MNTCKTIDYLVVWLHTQAHHQPNHTSVFYLTVLTIVTSASSNTMLPDDGDYTETCWSCFNVNFNVNFKTVFTTIHLCISWGEKNFNNIKVCGMYVKICKTECQNNKSTVSYTSPYTCTVVVYELTHFDVMWWVCMNISEEHAAFIIHQERR
jgi:hypothetical protein